jgi:hypothetical protein
LGRVAERPTSELSLLEHSDAPALHPLNDEQLIRKLI